MSVEVRLVQPRSIKWALGLLRFTWAPFSIDVVGRWITSFLQIEAATFIAFAAAQAGQSSGEESVIPAILQPYFPVGPGSILKAVAFALLLTVVSGILETYLAWTMTWTHLILNRRFTPAALQSVLAIESDGSVGLDPATAVQRWLLKSQIVEFQHNGIASILGAIGTIAIALYATFHISVGAGWVSVICLGVWAVTAAFLAWKTLQASRDAASRHEVMGRVIDDSFALRRELGRPSLSRFWMKRSRPAVTELGRSIKRQGIWGSLLFGSLQVIANAAPLLALLVVALMGGIQASIAIYLYVSRLVPPLGNLAGVFPVLQDQLISIQRMHDAFGRYRAAAPPEEDESVTPDPVGAIELRESSVRYPGATRALQFPALSIAHPQALCIIGPSGSGKSTLLTALAGQHHFEKGGLMVDGSPVDPTSALWRERCSFLPQHPELLPPTISDNLELFPRWQTTPEVDAVLELLSKGTSAGRSSAVGVDSNGVSLGQKRAIALLRNVGSDAPVLLLDEPIAGIDQQLVDLLSSAIHKAVDQGKLIIMTMHEHDYARLKMNNTRVLHLTPEGPPAYSLG
jgi:ABC-type multidrug transport system fused ATPase/permease subunit